MVNCDECERKIGLLESSYNSTNSDREKVKLCLECKKIQDKEIEKKEIEENKRKVKKALENNSQWEYKILNLHTVGDIMNATNHKINETYSDDLNNLGKEGWELVSATPMTSIASKLGASGTATSWVSCIFKRKL